jgi:hypothetical protein
MHWVMRNGCDVTQSVMKCMTTRSVGTRVNVRRDDLNYRATLGVGMPFRTLCVLSRRRA